MESYPGELLVGVSPLVFCVDATLERKEERNRSQFDKFLDTIAASSSMVDDDVHEGGPMMQRVEEEQSDNEDGLLLNGGSGGGSVGGPELHAGVIHRRRSISSKVISDSTQGPGSPTREQQDGKRRPSFSKLMSPKGSKRNIPIQRSGSGSGRGDAAGATETTTTSGSRSIGIEVSPSFAEALQQGQSFFQRARVVSTSARHGFPPSKDPTGKSNRVIAITGLKPGQQPPHRLPTSLQRRQHQKQANVRLKSAVQTRPIDGILPSGWLAKHAAALPSVIVVVTQIHPSHQDTQPRQDELLLEALENLRYSLAPKRRVDVKVVALVQEGVSPIVAGQWSLGMFEKLPSFLYNDAYEKNPGAIEAESIITLVESRELRSEDEDNGIPPHKNNPKSSPLPALYQGIQRSSLKYYKDRSREIKGKLLRLRGPQAATERSPVLMPLLVRYYFKAAIFYEFQWKQGKSLKYMVEAYRLVEIYYGYLLFWKYQREIGAIGEYRDDRDQQNHSNDVNLTDASNSNEKLQDPVLTNAEGMFYGIEGVEMSLSGMVGTSISTSASASLGDDYLAADADMLRIIADDMIHQCRAVADWLNFKILQMCFTCHVRSGTLAASVQWQRHAKTFCCPRRSFLNTASAPWLDWSYVAQQRVVVSQLLERYPPRALGELGGSGDSYDEDLLRCCSWRTYEAAAEALLKAGHRVRTVVDKGGLSSLPKGSQDGGNRIRYVGCIDHNGFRPSFEEESKKLHTERALNCSLRGISLYEKDLEKAEAAKTMVPYKRSGARLYYLAGGALLGLNRPAEAVPRLEKALKLCRGWSSLQSLVRRLLTECYQQQQQDGGNIVGSVEDEDGGRRARTSFLVESYFNARLPSDELEKALEKFTKMDGMDIGDDIGDGVDNRFIRWHCDFIDDETGGSPTPPFSFALTFPASTHGTPGNKVKASVWIKSNLEYAVCVSRVSMISFLGPLFVPIQDFPSNASHPSNSKVDGAITIQPGEAVEFGTELALPMDLAQSVGVGSINIGGEVNATSSNVSTSVATVAKNIVTKPRSGGFTAAGGCLYSVQDEIADKAPAPATVPWSIRCLGGKALRCEGMIMTFSVVSLAASNTSVKLFIETKQPEVQPNTKRTTFDEDQYVSSAWKRPPSLPLSKGPRCLRLLSPIANITITNVTEAFTNGTALEGTVNRVVLKLSAAENETCSNVVIQAKSSSVLIIADGKEKPICLFDGETSGEDIEDMMNPRVRAPVLVKPDSSSKTFMTDFGYILPSGWALAGDGHDTDDGYSVVAPIIEAGEETYACFDIYRPTSEPIAAHTKGNQQIVDETTKLNDLKCETKIDFSIRYDQEVTDDDKSASCDDRVNNNVSIDHSVTILWSPPMSVAFSSNTKEAYPSGNQHPSNIVSNDALSKKQPPGQSTTEIIAIDDGKIFTKGVLNPIASTDGLDIEIDKVQFIDTDSTNRNCKFQLLSGLDDEGTIFRGQPNNPCRTLRTGSKMSFAWMTEVCMDVEYREESLTASIGTVSIHWQPSPIELSDDLSFVKEDTFAGSHGPLQLERPSVCRFSAPICHIESAPFEVIPESLPDSIKVADPFEVTYRIKNKTPIDQELEILLQESSSLGDESSKDGFLIGGLVNKVTSLGPFESHSFSYTTVSMNVGKVDLPSISVSSRRYKTWIIRESLERRSIYVLP